MMDGFGWGPGFGGIFMILFWVLVIAGVVALVRWAGAGRSDGGERRRRTALDILEERYARGEIGREEFEQKRRDLER